MSVSTTHQRCKIVEESLLFFQDFIQNRCCNCFIIVVYAKSLQNFTENRHKIDENRCRIVCFLDATTCEESVSLCVCWGLYGVKRVALAYATVSLVRSDITPRWDGRNPYTRNAASAVPSHSISQCSSVWSEVWHRGHSGLVAPLSRRDW